MVDDAHDLALGDTHAIDVPLRIGTLSKTLGGYGGYLCASQPVIELMRNRARTLIYTTGLPPPVIAAAMMKATTPSVVTVLVGFFMEHSLEVAR